MIVVESGGLLVVVSGDCGGHNMWEASFFPRMKAPASTMFLCVVSMFCL